MSVIRYIVNEIRTKLSGGGAVAHCRAIKWSLRKRSMQGSDNTPSLFSKHVDDPAVRLGTVFQKS